MRYLITGSNGGLGSALMRTLLDRGHEVCGIDATASADAACPTHIGTLTDPYTIHRAFDRFGVPDGVAHLANHTNAMHAPQETVLRENLSMNTSVFIGALQAGVKRLAFSSSVQAMLGGIERWADPGEDAAYPPAFPISERTVARPSNTYGLSKLMTEQALEHAAGAMMGFGATCVSVRLPFIMREQAFERNLGAGGVPDFRWGGCEAFCYIHVDDAADAMARALTEDVPRGAHVVWCAAPDARGGAGVAELVEAHYRHVPGSDEAERTGTFHDCSRAYDLLGWAPARVLGRERAGSGG
ncbi:MAG: NAD(P)-dependent oxidoreductase [Planctomycetota bacterium]